MEKTYRFGEEEITANENLTVAEVQKVWAAVHPALENAEAVAMEDGSTEFRVRAGTKGADKTYRFGEEEITANENLTVAEVQKVWAAVHPALENAEAVAMEDGSTDFRVRAGTKG